MRLPVIAIGFAAALCLAGCSGVTAKGAASSPPRPKIQDAPTLATVGVPKAIHEGVATATVTLEKVRWLVPQNGATLEALATEFRITATGTKPFDAAASVSAWQYGTARDVDERHMSQQLWRSPDNGMDYDRVGRQLDDQTVKPGRTIDGWCLYGIDDRGSAIVLAWDSADSAEALAEWPLKPGPLTKP